MYHMRGGRIGRCRSSASTTRCWIPTILSRSTISDHTCSAIPDVMRPTWLTSGKANGFTTKPTHRPTGCWSLRSRVGTYSWFLYDQGQIHSRRGRLGSIWSFLVRVLTRNIASIEGCYMADEIDLERAHEFYKDPANLVPAGPGRRPKRPAAMSGLVPVRFTKEMIIAVNGVASQEGYKSRLLVM